MSRPGSWPRFVVAAGVFSALPSFGIAEEMAPVVEPYPPSEAEFERAPSGRSAGSRGVIELLNQMESLRLEVKRLRGELEVQNHTIEQLNRRQRDQYIDVDRRLQTLEGGRSGAASPPLDEAPPPETAPSNPPPLESGTATPGERVTPLTESAQYPPFTPPAPESQSMGEETSMQQTPQTTLLALPGEEEAYRQAFNQLKGGHYDQSISAFNNFLAQYPGSAHADNAQYWLGEAYYVKRQFEPAISEYTKLVQNHPQSQKLTHALLKIGYSYQELGQVEQAVASFQNLKTRYPGTTAARLAEERLQRIKLERP